MFQNRKHINEIPRFTTQSKQIDNSSDSEKEIQIFIKNKRDEYCKNHPELRFGDWAEIQQGLLDEQFENEYFESYLKISKIKQESTSVAVPIIDALIKSNKISCFKTYLRIKISLSGKIYLTKKRNDLVFLSNVLETSINNVKKHLNQLTEIGLIENFGNFYTITGNERYGILNKINTMNVFDFSLKDINFKFKDNSKLRSLLYGILFKASAEFYGKTTMSKGYEKYACKDKKTILRVFENQDEQPKGSLFKHQPRYSCSISWFSNTLNIGKSVVAKQRIFAKKQGFLDYKREIKVLFCTQQFEILNKNTEHSINSDWNFCFKHSSIENSKFIAESHKKALENKEFRDIIQKFRLFYDKNGKPTALIVEETPDIRFNIKLRRRKQRKLKKSLSILRNSFSYVA